MLRLYADEDFSHAAVMELRGLGHDVLSAREAGQAGQGVTDESVLAFAVSQRRVVVTFNRRHFIRLHQRGLSHFGIVVCSRDPDDGALAKRIHSAIGGRTDLTGQLFRVNRPPRP